MNSNYITRLVWLVLFPYNYLFFSLYNFLKSLNQNTYNPLNTHKIRVFTINFIFSTIISVNIVFCEVLNNYNLVFLFIFCLCYIPFAIFKDKIFKIKYSPFYGNFIILLMIIEAYLVIWNFNK